MKKSEFQRMSFLTKLRFKLGRSSTANRLKKLLIILKKEGFEFVTFSEFKKELIINNQRNENRQNNTIKNRV